MLRTKTIHSITTLFAKQSSSCCYSFSTTNILLHSSSNKDDSSNIVDNKQSSSQSSSREKLREMIQQYSHSIPDHLVRASSREHPPSSPSPSKTTAIGGMDPKNPYGDEIQMKEIKLRKQKTILELHFNIKKHDNNGSQPTIIDDNNNNIITSLLAEFLRVESPSAEVQGEGGQKRLVFGKRGIKISNIEMVGKYGIRIIFSDGHDSGIYSWNYLHSLGQHKFTMMKQYINDLRVVKKSRNATRSVSKNQQQKVTPSSSPSK